MSRARTVLATELLLIGGLFAFIGAAWAAERILELRDPVRLSMLESILLSAVPAFLWLGYFYLQDRHEPEPKHYVAGVYLVGAFVAAPIASFLTGELFPVAAVSSGRLSAVNMVTAILSVGLAQELSKFLVVRYSVYLSDEFDEPMDGIIYMTAAGIGFATAENVRYLQGLDGTVFLSTGAMNTVVTTLAHACFAGFLGFALGRARFSKASPLKRNLFLLGGLVMAAVLNGVFHLLERIVKVQGLAVKPWRGLVFAAVFAAVIFAGVAFLMKQQLAQSAPRTEEA
jgi:RsiW-degrading membrane proteinase PrsW (M82 family)